MILPSGCQHGLGEEYLTSKLLKLRLGRSVHNNELTCPLLILTQVGISYDPWNDLEMPKASFRKKPMVF